MVQSITLQTSDSDIISGDILGRLSFAASSETSGSDALLIGGGIYAEAEDTFTQIVNATSLVFSTASSETAIGKLKITSSGYFLPMLDNTYDIGSNSFVFRNLYVNSGIFTNLSVSGVNVSLVGHTHTASNITDFNTAVSGLLPVKNIVAGSNITISSSSGVFTINSTASGGGGSSSTVRGSISTTRVLSSFNVTGGYSVGYLDLFQNGVKLLAGSDFTATDGTSVTLSNSVPSGTVLEYISLGASLTSTSYIKLDSISSSFNGSSTSFGLAVSGTAYYPVSANTLGIYVGGVAQEPIVSYSVSGSNIVFTEAPASGLTFWGVGYGTTAVATLNGIVPGSSGSPAISSSNDLTSGFYFPSSGNISVAGNLGIGTSSPSTLLDVNNNKFRVRNSKTPSSATDTGNTGDICWDSSYIYVCTNTNSWTRTPISAWSSDPYFSYISLLLHMDGTGSSFVDSSLSPKTITATGSATQTSAQSKWGGKSASLTSGSLTTPSSSAFAFPNDFVIEGWFRFNANNTGYQPLITAYSGGDATGWALILETNNTLNFYGSSGSGWGLTFSSSYIPTTNQWIYITVSRTGSTIRMWIDGTSIASGTTTMSIASGGTVAVGYYPYFPGGARSFDGYIDDLRITVGSNRGYSGSTITVPTAAFPNYNT
jgi:hypothetical protein